MKKIQEEAEEIQKELAMHPELQTIVVTPEMDEALSRKIKEYELSTKVKKDEKD